MFIKCYNGTIYKVQLNNKLYVAVVKVLMQGG